MSVSEKIQKILLLLLLYHGFLQDIDFVLPYRLLQGLEEKEVVVEVVDLEENFA